jgi:hypothetical protein
MIELVAACAGALISAVAVMGINASKRNMEGSVAIAKLTSSVEHIAETLQTIHTDVRANNRELFGRLNQVENRVSKLEVR